jgi:hypothetical protein
VDADAEQIATEMGDLFMQGVLGEPNGRRDTKYRR